MRSVNKICLSVLMLGAAAIAAPTMALAAENEAAASDQSAADASARNNESVQKQASGMTNAQIPSRTAANDTSANGQWDSLTPARPSPSCYSITDPAWDNNWGIYFWFGGPGGAACE